MTYSSAIFKNADMSLQEASIFKLDRICRKLNLKDHDRVLEIGCGWGSFALRAASAYGCHVTAVTVSTEQYEYVKSQVDELGLAGRVHVLFSDYRDLQGNFDKIVSIEMIEAVGHENLPEFFEICRRLIKPEGQVALQAITMPDQRYKQYLDSCDFIQRYIFPGSCVPSLGALIEASAANTDLRICHVENIGLHYAETLKRWKSAFSENVDRIRALGYGESFLRLWWYYLNYCEAGFSTGYLGDFQIVMAGPSCRKTVVVEGLPPL
jgi:cyclopropane-fatty-acyl-phospholipid synthase